MTAPNTITCPRCGSRSYFVVDGVHMNEDELNSLRRAPKKIEHKMNHAVWCDCDENHFAALEETMKKSIGQAT